MNTTAKNTKKVSNYETIVLTSNKALKLECKTLGYAFKMITETKGVNTELIKKAKEVLKSKELYDTFAANVRKNKQGQFVPFYCMQLLYTMMQPKK